MVENTDKKIVRKFRKIKEEFVVKETITRFYLFPENIFNIWKISDLIKTYFFNFFNNIL